MSVNHDSVNEIFDIDYGVSYQFEASATPPGIADTSNQRGRDVGAASAERGETARKQSQGRAKRRRRPAIRGRTCGGRSSSPAEGRAASEGKMTFKKWNAAILLTGQALIAGWSMLDAVSSVG